MVLVRRDCGNLGEHSASSSTMWRSGVRKLGVSRSLALTRVLPLMPTPLELMLPPTQRPLLPLLTDVLLPLLAMMLLLEPLAILSRFECPCSLGLLRTVAGDAPVNGVRYSMYRNIQCAAIVGFREMAGVVQRAEATRLPTSRAAGQNSSGLSAIAGLRVSRVFTMLRNTSCNGPTACAYCLTRSSSSGSGLICSP